MSEKINSEMISGRGTFSLVWKAAAASLAALAPLWCWRPLRRPKHKPKAKQRRDTRQGGRQDRRDQRRQ